MVDKIFNVGRLECAMNNFTLYNPTKVIFGKGACAKISSLLPKDAKILLLYGGGSIKKNGVYKQVTTALKQFKFVEFAGIEANPEYETCMKALALIKKEKLNFVLAVGGGSVIDACKFIVAAAKFKGEPWDILSKGIKLQDAMPFATVLTLPATGSEMNSGSVISRRQIEEKLAFIDELVFPKFSVLDPTFTYSLPSKQVTNGIVDAFIHVLEQYLTYPQNAPLQDRFAEGIMSTLYEESLKVIKDPNNYDIRANIMFSATMALNYLISSGVAQDWATHMIGHSITALYGLDHAQTLAIVMPKIMKYKKAQKKEKILRLGKTVFGVTEKSSKLGVEKTITAFEAWLKKIGVKIQYADYGIVDNLPERVAKNLEKTGMLKLGEHADITPKDVIKLLKLK